GFYHAVMRDLGFVVTSYGEFLEGEFTRCEVMVSQHKRKGRKKSDFYDVLLRGMTADQKEYIFEKEFANHPSDKDDWVRKFTEHLESLTRVGVCQSSAQTLLVRSEKSARKAGGTRSSKRIKR